MGISHDCTIIQINLIAFPLRLRQRVARSPRMSTARHGLFPRPSSPCTVWHRTAVQTRPSVGLPWGSSGGCQISATPAPFGHLPGHRRFLPYTPFRYRNRLPSPAVFPQADPALERRPTARPDSSYDHACTSRPARVAASCSSNRSVPSYSYIFNV